MKKEWGDFIRIETHQTIELTDGEGDSKCQA